MVTQREEREGVAALAENIHSLMLEIRAGRLVAEASPPGKKPRVWETLAIVIALLGLLGSGINWLGSSGMAVGGFKETVQRLERDLQTERDERKVERDERLRLQGRFDRLRDLYMVEFGADPEDPNTKLLRKRGK